MNTESIKHAPRQRDARALVVGGNGFVGSHLVDALRDDDWQVRVFDRFSSNQARYDASDVERFAGDFMNVGELREALVDVDVVYHFLSTTTPATAEVDPLIDVRTNVTGTVELLRACAEAGVNHVYFASTGGAIYGDTPAETVTEEAPTNPISPYAIGKLAIEGYLRYFEKTEGLQATTFRISNPYGPRQHPERKQGVIPIFLRRVMRGEPLRLFGDGSMIRDYVYVEDAAKQMCRVSGSDHLSKVYNIGSGQPYTLTEVIEVIREVTGSQVVVQRTAAPATYIRRVVLDTQRFESEFGPTPLTSLRSGIKRTWDEMLTEETGAA